MAIHKLLVNDFFNESFILLAIHCSLPDYRIVYAINNKLGIHLKRKPKDLDYKHSNATYALFEWEDTSRDITWNLVANISKTEEVTITKSDVLFNTSSKIIQYNLVPEHKQVNYLLKINNDSGYINQKLLINKIQAIPQIVTVYEIATENLKSVNNLIFN